MEVGELLNKKKELNKDIRNLINKRLTQFCTECGVLVEELSVDLNYFYPGFTIIEKELTDATCNCTVTLAIYECEQGKRECLLSAKDEAVRVGYNNVNRGEYDRRHVFKDYDDDLYYTGWMDCFDWIANRWPKDLELEGLGMLMKRHVKCLIKQRIESEYRKHPDLDWAEIAARKIYAELTTKL